MPKKKDYEDEDEEDDDIDDFFKSFGFMKDFINPNFMKDFMNPDMFQKIFKEVFKKIMSSEPFQQFDFSNLNQKEFKKVFRNMMTDLKKKGPFKAPIGVYGFNIGIGPNGKPKIDSFGNIKPTVSGETQIKEKRDPLIEIMEEEDQITVIAEMPGVTKEDIEIKATDFTLTITAESKLTNRSYSKEIDLPAAIDSSYAKARYQNGILEIKLKKIQSKQTNIKIED